MYNEVRNHCWAIWKQICFLHQYMVNKRMNNNLKKERENGVSGENIGRPEVGCCYSLAQKSR